MLAIKNNIMAENSARHLGRSYDALAKSVERLSSGMRINSAKDDAAGLAVRELMRADIAVIKQGSRNAQDAISMVTVPEARNPTDSHWASSWVTPKDPMTSGIATLMIVLVSKVAKDESMVALMASQR